MNTNIISISTAYDAFCEIQAGNKSESALEVLKPVIIDYDTNVELFERCIKDNPDEEEKYCKIITDLYSFYYCPPIREEYIQSAFYHHTTFHKRTPEEALHRIIDGIKETQNLYYKEETIYYITTGNLLYNDVPPQCGEVVLLEKDLSYCQSLIRKFKSNGNAEHGLRLANVMHCVIQKDKVINLLISRKLIRQIDYDTFQLNSDKTGRAPYKFLAALKEKLKEHACLRTTKNTKILAEAFCKTFAMKVSEKQFENNYALNNDIQSELNMLAFLDKELSSNSSRILRT